MFFVVLELLFFQHLPLLGAHVDPLLFYLLWLIKRYNRIPLLFIAAILGLLQDSFFDLWGLQMFSKTLLIFMLYNFVKHRIENQLLLWQIFIFILVAALLHNLILFTLSSFFNTYASNFSPFILIFGNAMYTALVGASIYAFRIR